MQMPFISPETTPLRLDDHVNLRIRNDRVGLLSDVVRRRLAQTARITGQEVDNSLKFFRSTGTLEDDSHELDSDIDHLRTEIARAVDEDPNAVSFLASLWDRWSAVSPGISGMLGLDEHAVAEDYIMKLAERNADSSFRVSNQIFANIAERHNYNLAQAQAEFDKNVETYKENFRQRIRKGIEQGWIPHLVEQKLGKLDTTVIAIDDGGELMGGVMGNARSDYNEVVVADYLRQDSLEQTLTHEFVHILRGVDVNTLSATKNGMNKLFDSPNDNRVIDEAVVEHIADCLYRVEDDWNDADPHRSSKVSISYADRRQALNAILNFGTKKIDIRTVIAVYFEDGTSESPLCSQLRSEITDSFESTEFDIIHDVSAFSGLDDKGEGHRYAAKLWRAKEKREGLPPSMAMWHRSKAT